MICLVRIGPRLSSPRLDSVTIDPASFSFGLGDSFIVSDEGAASINFGELDPASSDQANGVVSRPITENPYINVPIGVNFNQFSNVPSVPGQGIRIINNATGQVVGEIPTSGGIFSSSSVLTSNGLQTIQTINPEGTATAGFETIEDITQGAPGSLNFNDTNGNGVFDLTDTVVSFVPATLSTIVPTLPSVIQYPRDCLLYTSPSPRDLSTTRMPSSA